jgi:hypothetical protein
LQLIQFNNSASTRRKKNMTTLHLRKSIGRSHLRRAFFLIPLLLACVALLPRVQASPDPPAIGGNNTRDGAGSLAHRTTGINNSAFGTNALNKLTIGSQNTAVGTSALFSLTAGIWNTAIGFQALSSDTTGSYNTATGSQALRKNTTGDYNTAVGLNVLYSNTEGFQNTATGSLALFHNTSGTRNTATGYEALFSNSTGNQNVATGHSALFSNMMGEDNTAIGYLALADHTTGDNNIALGSGAGASLFVGTSNIYIGNSGVSAESNTIRIGSGFQTRAFIAGIRGKTTGNANAVPVLIDSSGQLGTTSSSRRFKREIKAMEQASASILSLKPVTFHYKSDSTGTPQFGLIAEEVAKVNPDLVVRDENGEIYTVRYEAVNAMLLNEFLKEHRKNEEQEKTIAELKSGMTALAATVKEQASQIQKVSAQLEASKPAPQMVLNDQ